MPVSESTAASPVSGREGGNGREAVNTNKRKGPPDQRDPDGSLRANTFRTITAEQYQKFQKQQELLQKQLEKERAEREKLEKQVQKERAEREKLEKERAEREKQLERVRYAGSICRLIEEGLPELRGSGKPFEHANEGAGIVVDEGFISSEHLAFDVECRHQDAGEFHLQGEWILSDLANEIRLDKEDGQDKCFVSYTNKTTVQSLVYRLLKDVINVIGCKDVLEIYLELTIFGLRPDLVLVIHPRVGVVLIIEVKNPSADDSKVFSSEQIARQVHDYLKVMERTGHATPFVLVMTYEELVFARLHQENEKYSQVVQESAATLKRSSGKIVQEKKKRETKPVTSPTGKSPRENSNSENLTIPPVIDGGDTANNEDEDEAFEDEDECDKPVVVYSKIFGRQHVMKALILAVVCGIKSLKNMKPTNEGTGTLGGVATLPAEGQALERDMPFVSENKFRWKKCNKEITYQQFPGGNSKGFFLVDTLGVGNRGKVFLASNTSGRILALKFYPHDYQYLEAHNPDEREKMKKKVLEDTKKSAEEEAARWRLLYPQYKAMVDFLKLNDMWVVKMPYFAPIPKDQRLDAAVLQDVARILAHFATQNLYSKEVRWGHIGCRRTKEGQLEMTLLDLESLSDADVTDNPEYLRGHLTGLIERSGLVPVSNENSEALLDNLNLNLSAFV